MDPINWKRKPILDRGSLLLQLKEQWEGPCSEPIYPLKVFMGAYISSNWWWTQQPDPGGHARCGWLPLPVSAGRNYSQVSISLVAQYLTNTWVTRYLGSTYDKCRQKVCYLCLINRWIAELILSFIIYRYYGEKFSQAGESYNVEAKRWGITNEWSWRIRTTLHVSCRNAIPMDLPGIVDRRTND